MSEEKTSLFDKFLYVLSILGTISASIFFFLYRSEKSKKEKLEVREEIKDAEVKAKIQAEVKNEVAKSKGAIGLASDCADIIDDK